MHINNEKLLNTGTDIFNARYKLRIRPGPDGILLFDRHTGMNLLIDEVNVPQELWATAPRHVSIALTNACDLSCPHCYAPKQPANLNMEQLIAWIDELDLHKCVGVGFGGGEPTLYKNFPSLCKYITNETDMAVSFTTHGHHINDKMAYDLKGNVHFIRVSMDGVGLAYERIRKRPFKDLLNKFKLISKIAPFGINFVVNKSTLPDLNAAVKLAVEYGASEFLLLPEQPVRGHGGIDKQTMHELGTWLSSSQRQIPLRISEAGSEQFPICSPISKEKGLRSFAHIDALGILKYSSFDIDGVAITAEGIVHTLRLLESTRRNNR